MEISLTIVKIAGRKLLTERCFGGQCGMAPPEIPPYHGEMVSTAVNPRKSHMPLSIGFFFFFQEPTTNFRE